MRSNPPIAARHDYVMEQAGCDHAVHEPFEGDYARLIWCQKCRDEVAERQKAGIPHHQSLLVRYPLEDGHMFEEGTAVEIDEQIAPVILYLWKLGIDTADSCQGGPTDSAHILFVGADGPTRLLDSLSLRPSDDPNSLFRRSAVQLGSDRPTDISYWQYHTTMVSPGMNDDLPISYCLWTSLYFPPEDIDEIVQLIAG